MNNESWRKRLSVLLSRLYLYPAPEPMPHTRLFWVATGVVTVLALSFSIFFILFTTGQHDAFLTHGEDLGIMDQVVWSVWHGPIFHQSICNPISDTNCYGNLNLAGISRFAIHFDPILFLISLSYLVAPNPKTLQVIQTLVVASGAFPAFWLARLRLRSELASTAIVVLYLLYPALQWATIFDFHAVTLTASLLLFTLYFMYTRRTVLLFVFAILAMGCKEEIPVVVALYGLWSVVFQRRWRSGLALIVLAAIWTGVGLYVVHISSPTGHSLLASRYAYLGNSPLQSVKTFLRHPVALLKEHVFEHDHFFYLRTLFAPTAYLAFLAPWIWVLMLPTLALNLFSTNGSQYSGLYQYDAEMVPVLIFSTIEALVLIVWLVQKILARLRTRIERGNNGSLSLSAKRVDWLAHSGVLCVLLCGILFSVYHADYQRGTAPFSQGFTWPTQQAHHEPAQPIIDMIPQDASVSAQSNLIPHISHRSHIYQFPYGDTIADYVFLDTTSDITPFGNSYDYINEAKSVMINGHYGIVVARDGYLLLKHGLPAPGISPLSRVQPGKYVSDVLVMPNLPASFCSNINVSPNDVKNDMDVAFTSPTTSQATMDLIGYGIDAPIPFSVSSDSLSVTTYWKVIAPLDMPLQVVTFMTDKTGKEYQGTSDFPAVSWCQTQTLKAGMTIRLTSRLFNVQANRVPTGLAHVAIALVPLLQDGRTIMDVNARLPLHIVQAPHSISLTPDMKAVQVVTLPTVS
ncbi:MAG: hypothetical protein NVS4B12_14380 [Ktedonobacteraceae bacterium]